MKEPRKNGMPVLLIDDEELILKAFGLTLKSAGFDDVLTLSDGREALALLASQPVGAVVLDLNMPHLSGFELLPMLTRDYPHVPVIVVTANDEIATVVDCMRAGAYDYLVKPVGSNRLVTSVRKALEMRGLASELSSLKNRLLDDQLNHPEAFAAIVTGSKKMRAIFQYIEVVAGTRQPIMITGETGVGKELVAQSIHALSGRSGKFVAVNVAGLDDAMFSDTLFGHKKGAFTGADQAREGLIASAAQGTLFLDEIGDLGESSQIKLLRLLQEQEYYPVGSDAVRKSDARIVLATNHDLNELITTGRFRKDLYYRLFAHRIHIPPLRERLDDIPLLVDHFLGAAAASLQRKKPTAPPELNVLLSLYPFPGNVRELESLVFDAVARHGGGVLSMESFKAVIGENRPVTPGAGATGGDGGETVLTSLFGHFPTIAEVEEYLIEQALRMSKGNQGMAAGLLGIGRQTLNKRLNKG
ncbi:MAG: sigma-54-dependent Fis family transcriptional regulator [Deltaproteobacteria bacterium]|nr:MAG: sigma-54-dependent Fis family transcriptional regulator [Deltaproteobacteria bacterium]